MGDFATPSPAPFSGLLTMALFPDGAGPGPGVEAADVTGAMLFLAVGRGLVGHWTFLQVMNVVRYCPQRLRFPAGLGSPPDPDGGSYSAFYEEV